MTDCTVNHDNRYLDQDMMQWLAVLFTQMLFDNLDKGLKHLETEVTIIGTAKSNTYVHV